jgi:hypothetical protein
LRVNVGERVGGEHLLLGLALVVELLHAVARGDQHVVEFLQIYFGREPAVAGHDLGAVVRHFEVALVRENHAVDAAAQSMLG